jgi:ATP-dependent exoDNAse (exonuclease V) beta subunit
MWREVPVGTNSSGVLLEGVIDLLYELPSGNLAVVDYKTDRASSAEIEQRMEQYQLQGAAYALAVRQATGRAVDSVEFVFASLGETRSVAGARLQELVEQVLQRLADEAA